MAQPILLTATLVTLATAVGCAEPKAASDVEESNNVETINVSGTLYIGDPAGDLLVEAFTASQPGQDLLSITKFPAPSDVNGLYSLAIDVAYLEPDTNQAVILMTRSTTEKWWYLWSYHAAKASDFSLNINLMTSLVYEVAKIKGDLTLVGHAASEILVQEVLGLEERSTELDVTTLAYENLAAWVLAVQAETDATLSEAMIALAEDVSDGILDGLADGDEITIVEGETLRAFGHLEI